jgi:hypothetical protein
MRRETRSGGGRLHRRDRPHNTVRGKLRDGLQSEGAHRGQPRWRSSGGSNRGVTFDWSVLRLFHHAGNRADGAEVKSHGGFGETARKLEQAGGTETCPSGFRREIRWGRAPGAIAKAKVHGADVVSGASQVTAINCWRCGPGGDEPDEGSGACLCE